MVHLCAVNNSIKLNYAIWLDPELHWCVKNVNQMFIKVPNDGKVLNIDQIFNIISEICFVSFMICLTDGEIISEWETFYIPN